MIAKKKVYEYLMLHCPHKFKYLKIQYNMILRCLNSKFQKIKACLYHRWITLSIIIVVIVEFVLLQLCPLTDDINVRYLLSAISQSLAALFALTFALTILVLQLTYRYTWLLTEFFKDRFNLFYPILGSISIILPILILKMNLNSLLTNIAIAIATLCVFYIFPFFLRVKDFVQMNVGIREISSDMKQMIRREDTYGYRESIVKLVELAHICLIKNNFDVVKVVLNELLILSKYYFNKIKKIDPNIFYTLTHFATLLIEAEKIGIFKDAVSRNRLLHVATIVDDIPSLRPFDLSFIIGSLLSIIKSTSNRQNKRVACCVIWLLSAKLLAKNRAFEHDVKEDLKKLVSLVGKKFALKYLDPRNLKEYYGDAFFINHLGDHDRRMTEKLLAYVEKFC